MSRAYPIWNDITACIYNGSKSYGVKKECVIKQGIKKPVGITYIQQRVFLFILYFLLSVDCILKLCLYLQTATNPFEYQ